MRTDDTIAAIASPPGSSPRGLVRLSGAEARRLAATRLGDDVVLSARRGVWRGRWRRGDGTTLPLLVIVFPAPRSYTGEDVVELLIPGQPDLLAGVLADVLEAGARSAEPGEFTARAWFHGRMSLTEAEGVAATVAAASDAQGRAGRWLREGRLGRLASDLAEPLAGLLALVESGIDFADEEDVVAVSVGEVRGRLDDLVARIEAIGDRATGAERWGAQPRVVLAGPPNAGKSSLFNALLGRTRAVEADRAGTTRDVLVEAMRLDPADATSPEILLVDLAGLDDEGGDGSNPGGDAMDPLMQRHARAALAEADLVVRLEPADAPARSPTASAPAATMPLVPGVPELRVRSKVDLAGPEDPSPEDLAVSVRAGRGVREVREAIAARLADRAATLTGDAVALLPRHEQAFRRTREALEAARARVASAPSPEPGPAEPELLAADLRRGLDALAELAGTISPDDILGRIFADFCIGK